MAVDQTRYRELLNSGMAHRIALLMADPSRANVSGGAVSAPSALTAPATMAGTYTQTEVQQLRTDVANLRTTVNTLVTALKNAGVIT